MNLLDIQRNWDMLYKDYSVIVLDCQKPVQSRPKPKLDKHITPQYKKLDGNIHPFTEDEVKKINKAWDDFKMGKPSKEILIQWDK